MLSLLRRASAVIFSLSMTAAVASAQFKTADIEFSLLGSVGSYTSSAKNERQAQSTSNKYVLLAFTSGYYVLEGLSIEPEIDLIAQDGQKPVLALIGHVSYTMKLPESSIAPFARVGVGLANGFELLGTGTFSTHLTNNLDVSVLHVGAGAKFLLSKKAEIVTELQYRTQMYSDAPTTILVPKTTYTFSRIALRAGMALIL